MNRVQLLLALHCHLAVGSSAEELQTRLDTLYEPLLDVIEALPKLRLALHFSGALLEQLDEAGSEFLPRLAGLVAEGRIEMLGGAFYAPILAWHSERDCVGQIRMMSGWLTQRTEVTPEGAWLPEGVWDPSIPRVLARAGLRYTFISDSTFRGAGYEPLHGYYMTERQGHAIAVLPVDEKARELVETGDAQGCVDYLLAAARPEDDPVVEAVTVALSAEDLDLEQLQACLAKAMAEPGIELAAPGDLLAQAPARGRVYLPSASPQGAFYSRFLVEMPESNWMLQRVLRASSQVADVMGGDRAVENAGPNPPQMLRSLWRASCHDAFWPGRRGGIHAPGLRHSSYANLVEAERTLEDTQRSREDHLEHTWLDLDKDGQDELEVTGQFLTAYIKPNYGGSLTELDHKRSGTNVVNALRRLGGSFNDTHPRWAFMDHLLDAGATPEEMEAGTQHEMAVLADLPYRVVSTDFTGTNEAGVVHLAVTTPVQGTWLEIEKTYVFARRSASLALRYRVTNTGSEPIDAWLASELNLCFSQGDPAILQVPDSKDPLGPRGGTETAALDLVQPGRPVQVALRFGDAQLWWYPLESEHEGEEPSSRYQGVCLVPSWRYSLQPGQSGQATVRLAFVTASP